MRHAVLSMDVEDWYHLDYFDETKCSREYSMLDGIHNYCDLLDEHAIKSNFFVLGEIASSISYDLKEIVKNGHEIGSHGWSHKRPIKMSVRKFKKSLEKSKLCLEGITGTKVEGYRASCFSLDRERLDEVRNVGYLYDSSRISFSKHPLYQTIDMTSYDFISKNIYRLANFYEFQVSTTAFFRNDIPISGGGYLRILPWKFSKKLIGDYLKKGGLYILYIHPFELSEKDNPPYPLNTKFSSKLRFKTGRSSVKEKLSKLIYLLKDKGYTFTTFSTLRNQLEKK